MGLRKIGMCKNYSCDWSWSGATGGQRVDRSHFLLAAGGVGELTVPLFFWLFERVFLGRRRAQAPFP